MKKLVILAALACVSVANATTTSSPCDVTPPTSPLYYCNLAPPPNITPTCNSDTPTTTSCLSQSWGCGTTWNGGNPDCGGGGVPRDNVPDAASCLWLLGGALAGLEAARQRLSR